MQRRLGSRLTANGIAECAAAGLRTSQAVSAPAVETMPSRPPWKEQKMIPARETCSNPLFHPTRGKSSSALDAIASHPAATAPPGRARIFHRCIPADNLVLPRWPRQKSAGPAVVSGSTPRPSRFSSLPDRSDPPLSNAHPEELPPPHALLGDPGPAIVSAELAGRCCAPGSRKRWSPFHI